jgi:DNA polymerase III subunit delta
MTSLKLPALRGKKMLRVLIGEDDYSIRQALADIKKTIGDATALMTNTTVLDGKQVTVEQLRAAGETVPFLAEKRLVIVEGLLGRFESAGKNIKNKPSRPSNKSEQIKTIAETIKNLPPFTELVLLDRGVKSGNPLLSELGALTNAKPFPLMKGTRLNQWIERRVAATGGSISPQAVAVLIRFVGSDLWTMSSEVDKLIQFAGGRRIEEADVKAVVSYTQEANVFAMVDAIMEFRAAAAQELLQQQFQQGAAPAQLLAMLARQVRIIFQVKEMRDRRKPRGEIQSRLGLTSDFILNKAWEQADKYSLARLREMFHRLLEADLSIKTGKLDGEIALDALVAELGQKSVTPA